MKSKRILVILLLIILLLFYISNVKTIYTIDDMAYVIALGLDTASSSDTKEENSNQNSSAQGNNQNASNENNNQSNNNSSTNQNNNQDNNNNSSEQDNNSQNNSKNTSDSSAQGNSGQKSNNKKLELTLQIALHSSSSDKGSSSSQSSSTLTSTVNCNSISEGINYINSYIGKKLNLSYCKAIVISEELTKKGINDYVATLVNDIEVRPYCDILISKCKTKDFLQNSEPYLEKLSAKYYDNESISEKITGYTQEVSLLDFYNNYYDTFREPIAILGDKNSLSTDNDDKTEKLGLAVFHKGSFAGELNYTETLCHLMVSNKLESATLTIPSPFSDSDYITLQVSSVKTKKNVDLVDNKPFISCDIAVSTRILSSSINANYMTKENIEKIEEAVNSYLKNNVTNYLYKTSQALGADIDSFGSIAVRKFVTQESWDNFNWLDKYSSSTFNVDVKTKLRSSYLILGLE